MNIEQVKDKILNDDEFIIGELKNFLVYYNLKHTLRWGVDNGQKDSTESVAEHIYGMHILAEYFLPFYPELSNNRVKSLITWHDMAEALVDDMRTKEKTDEHRKNEYEAEKQIVDTSGNQIKEELRSIFVEYELQESVESKFVKAIDKAEPLFHMYFSIEFSRRSSDNPTIQSSEWVKADYVNHLKQYIEDYNLLWRFQEIIIPELDKASLFIKN
jgi:5'-deoxynucleotidase YfbR-like HD superfamily hydrolase